MAKSEKPNPGELPIIRKKYPPAFEAAGVYQVPAGARQGEVTRAPGTLPTRRGCGQRQTSDVVWSQHVVAGSLPANFVSTRWMRHRTVGVVRALPWRTCTTNAREISAPKMHRYALARYPQCRLAAPYPLRFPPNEGPVIVRRRGQCVGFLRPAGSAATRRRRNSLTKEAFFQRFTPTLLWILSRTGGCPPWVYPPLPY